MTRLFVGNLPYEATETGLRNWFAKAGVDASSVTLELDPFTGEPRGFGYVELRSSDEAGVAVRRCNGRDFRGRTLVIGQARQHLNASTTAVFSREHPSRSI